MPVPGYIMCAQSGAIDQFNQLVSHFGAIETIQLIRVPQSGQIVVPAGVRFPVSMRIVAVWFRDDAESASDPFEAQIVGHFPSNHEEIVLATFDEVRMTEPVHRLLVQDGLIPAYVGPGLLRIECRMRRHGETEWRWRQQYTILLTPAPEPATQPTPSGAQPTAPSAAPA